jgi:hypothetical protein
MCRHAPLIEVRGAIGPALYTKLVAPRQAGAAHAARAVHVAPSDAVAGVEAAGRGGCAKAFDDPDTLVPEDLGRVLVMDVGAAKAGVRDADEDFGGADGAGRGGGGDAPRGGAAIDGEVDRCWIWLGVCGQGGCS